MNASEFIRSQSTSAPAKEIVAAGEKKGIKLNAALVNVVRWRAAQKGKPKKRGPGRPKKNGPGRPKNGHGYVPGTEAAFRALVMDLGVARSKDILANVERAVAQIVAGQ